MLQSAIQSRKRRRKEEEGAGETDHESESTEESVAAAVPREPNDSEEALKGVWWEAVAHAREELQRQRRSADPLLDSYLKRWRDDDTVDIFDVVQTVSANPAKYRDEEIAMFPDVWPAIRGALTCEVECSALQRIKARFGSTYAKKAREAAHSPGQPQLSIRFRRISRPVDEILSETDGESWNVTVRLVGYIGSGLLLPISVRHR